jgi:hypothetical protein
MRGRGCFLVGGAKGINAGAVILATPWVAGEVPSSVGKDWRRYITLPIMPNRTLSVTVKKAETPTAAAFHLHPNLELVL